MTGKPECVHCGCNYETLQGDGTLASPYECDSCWTHYAESGWYDYDDQAELTGAYLRERKEEVEQKKARRHLTSD